MITVRAAADRGRSSTGWLHSAHSFSFGSYFDLRHQGHGNLLVLNDDTVAPGQGWQEATVKTLLSRLIAIKTMQVNLPDQDRERFNALFVNEAKAAAEKASSNRVDSGQNARAIRSAQRPSRVSRRGHSICFRARSAWRRPCRS